MSQNIKAEIERCVRWRTSARGADGLPATAGNFSVRDAESGVIFISRSGLDKGRMTAEDLLALDADGQRGRRARASLRRRQGCTWCFIASGPRRRRLRTCTRCGTRCYPTRCAEAGHVAIEGYEL